MPITKAQETIKELLPEEFAPKIPPKKKGKSLSERLGLRKEAQ